MTGIENVTIRQAIIHRVGNPSRGETLKLSQNPLTLNDPLVRKLLIKYFLGAINENELYHFTHLSDLQLNEVYNYVKALFKTEDDFVRQSFYLAQFLYSKSTHVKVKEGELCIVQLGEVPFENETVFAIGIYKAENKESFLKIFEHGDSFEMVQEDGISISKPDKACLVFKTSADDGYRVCVIDHTNKQQDAQYWVNDFLQVQPIADSYHHTDKYLSLCKQFVTNEYPDKFEITKTDQIEMLNRSMDYFKTRDLIERGVDETTGKKYYKIYYEEEL